MKVELRIGEQSPSYLDSRDRLEQLALRQKRLCADFYLGQQEGACIAILAILAQSKQSGCLIPTPVMYAMQRIIHQTAEAQPTLAQGQSCFPALRMMEEAHA